MSAGVRRRDCPSPAAARQEGLPVPPDRAVPLGHPNAGVAYGFWKPASWRIFCASGVLSQATNAAAASAFLDCLSEAAG